MFKYLRSSLLAVSLLPVSLSAQDVDRTKYPDYSDKINPDYSLMKPMNVSVAKAVAKRPDHVNNAETPYFPPVFNQAGGSCGSASRICYMFSHELNSFRGLDGKDPNNYYPSHFVWLLTNGNSGKDDFVQFVGVPSAATYGGQTFSKYFGYQECEQNDFGWMQGYDKWYSAMFNRMLRPVNFPVSVEGEEGREAVKNYLWNHNGDTDFHAGGIVGIGVAASIVANSIPNTPTNSEIGVAGMAYVKEWGEQVNHALTIVGYDDRIEFDLNGNGKFGEEAADEKGAWIIVNSWGNEWQNKGFIYCPYAYGVPAFHNHQRGNGFWMPEIYHVRKNYRPLRTIKLKMDYSRRSELFLSAGVSSDLNAKEPESSVAFHHFKYAGDGKNGSADPAPEIPMLGKWADGKLHDEPMEFGYDLTDLSASFDKNMPLKYFFIIDTKSSARGHGKIHEASIIDYEYNPAGVETPFNLGSAEGVTIQNKGKKTIISVIVQGQGIYAPQNAIITEGVFSWNSPVKSSYKLTGYNVYKGKDLVATLGANETSFTLRDNDITTYDVSALYGDIESSKVTASVPNNSSENFNIDIKHSGLSIPQVFASKYETATIEYWINCNSVLNWNQSAGPGWGQFMFHANSNGNLTAGWDTSNRIDASGAFVKGRWKHIAIVVNKNRISLYVDGQRKNTMTSQRYSGIGGFGDLVFSNNNNNNSFTDAKIDELRIWRTARTDNDIRNNRNLEFNDVSVPEDLVAYFKGDMITVNGEKLLRDHSAGQHHARLLSNSYESTTKNPTGVRPTKALNFRIDKPTEPIYIGVPVKFAPRMCIGASKIVWKAQGTEVDSLMLTAPTFTFTKTGMQKVVGIASNETGRVISDTIEVEVLPSAAPDASFTATKTSASAGENITLLASKPQIGYLYKWSMPGADIEEANSANASTSYQKQGTYTVTFTVTTPDGKSASTSQQLNIKQVAPQADFDVTPGTVIKGQEVKLIDKSKYEPKTWKWELKSDANIMLGEGQNLTFTPNAPGMYDVTLKASNESGESSATQKYALVVCNADSKNGLSLSESSEIDLTKVPFVKSQRAFTIDWWMLPTKTTAKGNGIGNMHSDLLISTNGNNQMVVEIKGKTISSENNFVKTNQWHHYAITLERGKISFFRDGHKISQQVAGVPSMPAIAEFHIGGKQAPFNGRVDEFRVWNQALSEEQLQSYINQPIADNDIAAAESKDGLQVYYQFNQNGGDVKDMTSNNNTGTRVGFGPDGDAWGLSTGVFALNFNAEQAKDVTNQYIKNHKAPFSHTGKTVDGVNKIERFMAIADWTLENTVEGTTHKTGTHVDRDKKSSFAITTEWDGFATKLENHKVYQTVTLPAGTYQFVANYGEAEGQSSNCYLVINEGKGLPDTNALSTALVYTPMKEKSAVDQNNAVIFTLEKEATVSLGILANLAGKQNLNIESFNLISIPVTIIEGTNSGIEGVVVPSNKEFQTIFDLSGQRVLTPQKGQVYIINGKKVIFK